MLTLSPKPPLVVPCPNNPSKCYLRTELMCDYWVIDIVAANDLRFKQKWEVHKMQAYCMKCRVKREMKNAKAITMKNGKPATQGVCPVCGTKMFRIGKS